MGLISELRSRARYVVGPVLGICTVGYFSYHIIHGERGLYALRALTKQVAEARAVYTETSLKRKVLENRVRLLSPGSLDPDMLEERARIMLDFAYPDETVILTGPPSTDSLGEDVPPDPPSPEGRVAVPRKGAKP